MTPIRALAVLVAVSGAIVATPAPAAEAAGVRVAVITASPPSPRLEVRTVAPKPDHVWISGHWRWNGSRHVWVAGQWTQRPHPGASWVPGRWTRTTGGWLWVEGHWRGR
jgi:hypothetical protein